MPPKTRDTTKKQGFTQPAPSELSGKSADDDDDEEQQDEEQGEGSEDESESEEESSSQAASASKSVVSSSARSKSSAASGSKSEKSESKSGSKSASASKDSSSSGSDAAGSAGGSDEEAGEKTPLMPKGKAVPQMRASTAAKAFSKAKAKAKSKVRKPTEPPRPSIPWIPILIALLVVGAIAGIVTLIWSQWCVLSEWGPWSACSPKVLGGPHCEEGVQHQTRRVIKGNCGYPSMKKERSCWMGQCRIPDLLMEEEALPCNAQSRTQILKQARQAFGGSVWKGLRSCKGSYLCCYPCEDVSDLAGPLECGQTTILPRPIYAGSGCFSCFAAQSAAGNASLPVCAGSQAFCQKGALSGSTTSGSKMCCFAAGPQPASPGVAAAGGEANITLDTQHFDRYPNTSSFLGELHRPEVWPVVGGEAECQMHCWHDDVCYLYTYVGRRSSVGAWRGHCITWDLDVAKDHGRSKPSSWLSEPFVFSGIKADVKYSTVIVTIRTAEAEGSSSTGTFRLLLCAGPEDCEDRSPMLLTSTSCRLNGGCLSRGHTSEFVGDVPVPHGFELHSVHLKSMTDDSWTFERIVVDCEGQVGTHHGLVTLKGEQEWRFPVGCVTTKGLPCLSPCTAGSGSFGWCYTDEEQTESGDCVEACSRHSPNLPKPGEESMKVSGMSCAELNWPTRSEYNDDPSVCASSSDAPLLGCSGFVTWMQAKDFCEDVGARLCTQKELEEDETAGSGCDLDQRHVWSSTSCERGDGGYMILPGASRYSDSLKPECALPDVMSVLARCCADVRKLFITFTRENRDANLLPKLMHVQQTGGLANWQVVAGTDHAGEFGFFLQSGMLYDQAPQDSEHVDVTLEDVPVSPRGGEIQFYFKVDSEPGQDKLHFYIDGLEQTTAGFPISGKVDWRLVAFPFPAQPNKEFHAFRWSYQKDLSVRVGSDVACVDKITVLGVLGQY